MTIQNTQQGPDGNMSFVGETLHGEPVTLQKVESLKAATPMGEGTYGIPADLVWLPLPGEPIFLAKTPEDIDTVEQAQQMPNQVQVGSTGPGEFSMDGPPLAKVAREQKYFLTKTAAEFMLVAMGVNPFSARDALSRAEMGSKVKLAGREIVPLSHLHKQMVKKAHTTLGDFPYHLRQNLVKEATVIDDADTADKVLSMNFLNPDNISTFAKYLPELDQASKKLAEMLVATRLGMQGPDEGAVERSMMGMERVIDGLKTLQQNSAETD
jgi:hypothetical protein